MDDATERPKAPASGEVTIEIPEPPRQSGEPFIYRETGGGYGGYGGRRDRHAYDPRQGKFGAGYSGYGPKPRDEERDE